MGEDGDTFNSDLSSRGAWRNEKLSMRDALLEIKLNASLESYECCKVSCVGAERKWDSSDKQCVKVDVMTISKINIKIHLPPGLFSLSYFLLLFNQARFSLHTCSNI